MNSEAREREAFAAGMKKAAEILQKKADAFGGAHGVIDGETGSLEFGNSDHFAIYNGWLEDAEEILAAIPADARAALSTEAQPEVTGAVAQNVSAAAEKYAEPWTYVTAEESMISERKFQIETLGGYAERKIITGWVSFDDARRIVACVNACRGIETETLENIGRIVPAETHAKKNPVAKVVFDTSKDLDGNVTKSRPQIFKEMGDKQLMQFEPDTPLYPPSAIEAAVREKLEAAALIAEAYREVTDGQSMYIADKIRALMESPHTSVEEPAN